MSRLVPCATILIAVLLLAACGSRVSSTTVYRPQISQEQLLEDVAAIRKASGVEQVTYTHDVAGAARLVVTYEPGKEAAALQAATERGYRRSPD
jgi:uncharacterized lipoprotein YmbA